MGKLLIMLLLLPSIVSAAPFLICDPQAGVETYQVYQDGAEIAADVPAEADGSLRYDLVGVVPGVYEFTAKSCNVWGCSALSPDPFTSPGAAQPPIGIRGEP